MKLLQRADEIEKRTSRAAVVLARNREVHPQAAKGDDDARGYGIPNPHHPAAFRIPPTLQANKGQAPNAPFRVSATAVFMSERLLKP
jgi:hypothetical protein